MLTMTPGTVNGNAAPIAVGSPATLFVTIMPIAPAAAASASFCEKVQMPRLIKTIAPVAGVPGNDVHARPSPGPSSASQFNRTAVVGEPNDGPAPTAAPKVAPGALCSVTGRP